MSQPPAYDENHCPNCSHDILNWDTACPGCDQVPWETALGQRVLKQRRWQHALRTEGPLLSLLLLIVMVGVAANLHYTKIAKWSRVSVVGCGFDQDRFVKSLFLRGNLIAGQLATADATDANYPDLVNSMRQWIEAGLPEVLKLLRDTSLSEERRAKIAKELHDLVDSSPRVRQLFAEHRSELAQALTPLLQRSTELQQSTQGILASLTTSTTASPSVDEETR